MEHTFRENKMIGKQGGKAMAVAVQATNIKCLNKDSGSGGKKFPVNKQMFLT